MKLVEIKCPNCGAVIKLEDSNQKTVVCKFCGSQFYLDDEIKSKNTYTNQTVYKQEGLNGSKLLLLIPIIAIGICLGFFMMRSFVSPMSSDAGLDYASEAAYYKGMSDDMTDSNETYANVDLPYTLISDTEIQFDDYRGYDEIYGIDYEKVKGIVITDSVYDTKGLEKFTNLESLQMGKLQDSVKDIKFVANMKNLKTLSLEATKDSVSDFSPVTMLKNLNSLSLTSENIKDISFIKELPNLKRLYLEDTQILSVDVLNEKPELEYLGLSDNDELEDYSPVASLENLNELVLNVEWEDEIPSLSNLTKLEKVSVSGGNGMLESFKGLDNIKSLYCSNSIMADGGSEVVSTLTGLEELIIGGGFIDEQIDLRCVSKLPDLKKLSIRGTDEDYAIMQSIASGSVTVTKGMEEVLNHQTLKELHIDKTMIVLDKSKVKGSDSLRILTMDSLKVVTNYRVENDGWVTAIDYDEQEIKDFIDIVGLYPNLEFFSAQSNMLDNIDFLANCKELREVNLQDNYISDFSVLSKLDKLESVDVSNNPGRYSGSLR